MLLNLHIKRRKAMKRKFGFITFVTVFVLSSFMTEMNFYTVEAKTLTNLSKFVPSTTSNLIGAEAAKADTDLTLADMLTYAIQDEYLAKAKYSLVVEKFGQQRPFINIISAEVTHINALTPLFTKYNVALPEDNSKNYIKTPTSIKESLENGVKGEIENIAMYERFLKQDIPSDVKTVFTRLRNASQNHLQAFQRALSSY
ncbi:hypothetical protein C1I91_14995 [Clostridium manihotivorum]|uniref:DUF2202 domain-containing protein n=2 Tax=Clostridium manihotivorum TaxID=2320868 RepID=A0A410DUN6_9CLOT|nr:hypothetical protein C1I91_14995 [Clostridium manihotivorum]